MSDSKLIQEWFNYSQNDLISARHLFEDLYPKQSEIACYLSQQSAEKALKGYLLFKETEPPRTHNLVELCQICMKHDSLFSEILDACSDLTPYGVAIRYPNELAVDEIIAKSAINKAQMSLFQNPMVFPQALGKSGLKPAFSRKSKVAVPKLKFWNSLR